MPSLDNATQKLIAEFGLNAVESALSGVDLSDDDQLKIEHLNKIFYPPWMKFSGYEAGVFTYEMDDLI